MKSSPLMSGAVVAAARNAIRETCLNGGAKEKQFDGTTPLTPSVRGCPSAKSLSQLRPRPHQPYCADAKGATMHRGRGGIARLAGEIGLLQRCPT